MDEHENVFERTCAGIIILAVLSFIVITVIRVIFNLI